MTTALDTRQRSDQLARSSVRTLLFVLRARAVFVLLALLVLFSLWRHPFHCQQFRHPIQARSDLGNPRHWHDLCRPHRRHRSFRRIVGRPWRHGCRIPSNAGILIAGIIHYPPVATVVLITVVACIVVGLLNGWLVAKAGVAPFIAT